MNINNDFCLLVISHVVVFQDGKNFYGYTPFILEINELSKVVSWIILSSPKKVVKPNNDTSLLIDINVSHNAQPIYGGENIGAKIIQILAFPFILFGMLSFRSRADGVQVRCPGNLGLAGVIIGRFISKNRIAKYAGQWNDYPGEPFTYRLQKWLLRSKWWNAPVLVYGEWPNQPKHIIPFFTSVMTENQMDLAREASKNKTKHNPLRILFVGRLSEQKNVHILIKALEILKEEGVAFECNIIGEGDKFEELEALVVELDLNQFVNLLGGMPFDKVLEQYAWADCLVLASETEGWPKAIAEAMAFGVVCVGSNRGLVPEMLSDGRGYTVQPGDPKSLADQLCEIDKSEYEFSEMSMRAAEWSQQYTLEKFGQAVKNICETYWDVQL